VLCDRKTVKQIASLQTPAVRFEVLFIKLATGFFETTSAGTVKLNLNRPVFARAVFEIRPAFIPAKILESSHEVKPRVLPGVFSSGFGDASAQT
jgi:hypothetical protein